MYQSIDSVYVPSEASEQNDDQDDYDQRRKSPAQQKIEQIPPLCVLIIHHQDLPEVHRLRKKNNNLKTHSVSLEYGAGSLWPNSCSNVTVTGVF